MKRIRETIPIRLSKGDKFVALKVEEAMNANLAGGGRSPAISYDPECNNQSHASIQWDDMLTNHQEVAAELQIRISSPDVYEAIPDRDLDTQ